MLLLLAIACAPHVVEIAAPAASPGAQGFAAPVPAAAMSAPPGGAASAAALHHAAVAAAQVGDLAEAVALAREAYVAAPDRRRHRYLQGLELRLERAGGVAALP